MGSRETVIPGQPPPPRAIRPFSWVGNTFIFLSSMWGNIFNGLMLGQRGATNSVFATGSCRYATDGSYASLTLAPATTNLGTPLVTCL